MIEASASEYVPFRFVQAAERQTGQREIHVDVDEREGARRLCKSGLASLRVGHRLLVPVQGEQTIPGIAKRTLPYA